MASTVTASAWLSMSNERIHPNPRSKRTPSSITGVLGMMISAETVRTVRVG